MNKISQLTNNSWLIRSNTVDFGILFKRKNDYLFLSPNKRLEFNDMQSVYKKFGVLQEDIQKEIQENFSISGFPVKHDKIEIISENPPLYKKINVVFGAGYWGIDSSRGWSLVFCPKYETCTKYGSVGPFKNRLEALNHLNSLNNSKNIKNRYENKL